MGVQFSLLTQASRKDACSIERLCVNALRCAKEGTRAAVAALGDMVRMIGDDDTGEAGHAQ